MFFFLRRVFPLATTPNEAYLFSFFLTVLACWEIAPGLFAASLRIPRYDVSDEFAGKTVALCGLTLTCYVNTHAPDHQTAKTIVYTEMLTLADDRLIVCIWLAASSYPLDSYGSFKGVLSISQDYIELLSWFYSVNQKSNVISIS